MKNRKIIISEDLNPTKRKKFEIEVDDGENVFQVEVEVSDEEELPIDDIKPTITEEVSTNEISSYTLNNSDGLPRCYICGFYLADDQFRAHLKDHYIQKQQCHLCDLEFQNIIKYKRHVLHDHNKKKLDIYRCKHCDIFFRFGSHYKLHLENIHGIKLFSVDTPKPTKPKQRKKYRTKKKTKKKKKTPAMGECTRCGLSVLTTKMYRHMLTHKGATQTCKTCGLRFKNVEQHIRMSHIRKKEPKVELPAVEELDTKPLITDVLQIEPLFTNVPEVTSLCVEEPEIKPLKVEELDIKPVIIEETETEEIEEKISLSILNSSCDNSRHEGDVKCANEKEESSGYNNKPFRFDVNCMNEELERLRTLNSSSENKKPKEANVNSTNEKQERLNTNSSSELLSSLLKKQEETSTNIKKVEQTGYKCKLCSLEFEDLEELKIHILETHEKEKRLERYCCKKCNLSFQLRSDYKSHVEKMHKNDEEEPCPTEKAEELRDSYMREKCTVCGMMVRKVKLSDHVLNHDRPKDFCEICGKFVTHIRGHIENVHTTPTYTCKKCGLTFTKILKYNLHLNKHLGIRRHVCKTCGKSFLTSHCLTKHTLGTHLKLRAFVCEICKKAFSSNFARKTHYRQHTNETPFKCEECGDGFKHNVSLKAHRKSKHNISEPKNCPCPVCGKKFPSNQAIETHLRVH